MTAPLEGEPLLDEGYVHELAMLFGADFLRRQFAAFETEVRSVWSEIGDLLTRDRPAASEHAHRLKGAALAVGARRLAARLNELEAEPSPRRLNDAIDCGRDTEAEITRFTAGLPPP